MNGGLSRERILRGSDRFALVREYGKTERSHFLSLGILPLEQLLRISDTIPRGDKYQSVEPKLQIGLITPKHLGKAHARNRLRRQLREIVANSPLPETAPYWLVLVARHPAAKADFPTLRRHWEKLARRAQLPGFKAENPPAPSAKSPSQVKPPPLP